MNINFNNRTVLITGATKGIGKVTAELFEKEGANLILTGVEKDLIEKLNDESDLSKKKYFYVDLSNSESINQFINELEQYDKIDVLVNNAGINIIDDFIDTKDADYELLMNINLKGPYLLSKYVARRMKEAGFGRIVNLASIWSVITRPKRAIYTMTKKAIHGMTQTMGVELAKHNVLVNAISPGFTLTELTLTTNTPEELEKISKLIPIERMANPIEQAKVIFFLCSELNTYIAGQNIVVDGGYSNV